MAVLQRDKNTVYGLNQDLINLTSEDNRQKLLLDTINGDNTVVGSIAKAEKDATVKKTYIDI